MSAGKKAIREAFRTATFKRDGHKCRKCGVPDSKVKLDAHHITNREAMPNGGYVAENAVSLCDIENGCHFKAEEFYRTGVAVPGYSPEELYRLIGSSYEKAVRASEKLAR